MRKKGSKVGIAILLSAWPQWLPLTGSRAMDRVKRPRGTSSALILSREFLATDSAYMADTDMGCRLCVRRMGN